MGILALDSAISGLRISQLQLDTISTNISNANTEGYTRKILPQETVSNGNKAIGVRAGEITRNVNSFLQRDLWTQVSRVGYETTQVEYLSRIEQFHGPPDRELSIASEVNRLKNAFSALSDTPEERNFQRIVVDEATDLANRINDFADLITDQRNQAEQEIDISVTRINELTSLIAGINADVSAANLSGRSAVNQEDQRDVALVSS